MPVAQSKAVAVPACASHESKQYWMSSTSNVTLELAPPERSHVVRTPAKSNGTISSTTVVLVACLVPSMVAVAAIGVAATLWARVENMESKLVTIVTHDGLPPDGFTSGPSLLQGTGCVCMLPCPRLPLRLPPAEPCAA